MSDRSRPQLRGPTVAPGMAAVRLLTPASRRMSADAPATDVTSHADAPPVSARLALWLGTAFGAKGCVGRRRLLSVGVPITSPRHDLGIAMKSGAGVRGRESRSRSVVEHEGLGARSSADGEPSSGAFAASGSKHGSRWARPGRFSHGLLPYQSRLPMAPDTSVSVSCEPLARLTPCSADTALGGHECPRRFGTLRSSRTAIPTSLWGASAGGRHRTDDRSGQRPVAALRVEPTRDSRQPARRRLHKRPVSLACCSR